MANLYVYETVEPGIFKLTNMEYSYLKLVMRFPGVKDIWRIWNRVGNYCLDNNIELPWIGTKYQTDAKGLKVIKDALEAKSPTSAIPTNIIHIKPANKSNNLVKVISATDTWQEGDGGYFKLAIKVTNTYLTKLLSKYYTGSNYRYKIELSDLKEELPLVCKLTEKDLPYSENKEIDFPRVKCDVPDDIFDGIFVSKSTTKEEPVKKYSFAKK